MLTVTPFQIAFISGYLLINNTLFLVSIRLIQRYDSKLCWLLLETRKGTLPLGCQILKNAIQFIFRYHNMSSFFFFSLKSVYGEMFLSTHLLAIQIWSCEVFNYDSYQEWDFLNIPKPLKLVSFSPSPKTAFGYFPIAILCLELRIPHPLFISALKGLFRPFQRLLSLPKFRSSDTEINGDTFMAYLNVTGLSLTWLEKGSLWGSRRLVLSQGWKTESLRAKGKIVTFTTNMFFPTFKALMNQPRAQARH